MQSFRTWTRRRKSQRKNGPKPTDSGAGSTAVTPSLTIAGESQFPSGERSEGGEEGGEEGSVIGDRESAIGSERSFRLPRKLPIYPCTIDANLRFV
jgi:hypothetical protein